MAGVATVPRRAAHRVTTSPPHLPPSNFGSNDRECGCSSSVLRQTSPTHPPPPPPPPPSADGGQNEVGSTGRGPGEIACEWTEQALVVVVNHGRSRSRESGRRR
ncbi:hypothetical protein VPH35_038997 [Triticum aestivum]